MSETPEQTEARFAAKDQLFEFRKKLNKWPLLECEECRYWACTGCGKQVRESLLCEHCGSPVTQRVACHQRAWHRVGDCCTHCGNDERKL